MPTMSTTLRYKTRNTFVKLSPLHETARMLAFSFALIALLFSAAAAREWTIMYYMIGEPDIEPKQVDNLVQMGQEGSDRNVQVVAQVDFSNADIRAKGTLTGNRRFQNTARFVVNRSGIEMTRDLGSLNAGDPQTLIDFMRWAITNWPAQRYALVFDCHSSGVESYFGPGSAHYYRSGPDRGEIPFQRGFSFTPGIFMQDEEGNDTIRSLAYDDLELDCLTLEELDNALKQISRELLNGRKLDALALASCVTQQIEFLTQVKDSVKYISGSQANSYAGVVNWRSFMSDIKANPRMGGDEFSKIFSRHLIGTGFLGTVGAMLTKATASSFDLSRIDPVITAMNDLSSLLIRIPRSQLTFRGQLHMADMKRYWDLGNFLKAIHDGNVGFARHSLYPEIRGAAARANNAIIRATMSVWTVGGWNHKGLIGLGIYWPYEDRYKSFRSFYATLRFARLTRWDDFLNLHLLGVAPSRSDMLSRLQAVNEMDMFDDAVYDVRVALVDELLRQALEEPEAADEIIGFIEDMPAHSKRGFEDFDILRE